MNKIAYIQYSNGMIARTFQGNDIGFEVAMMYKFEDFLVMKYGECNPLKVEKVEKGLYKYTHGNRFVAALCINEIEIITTHFDTIMQLVEDAKDHQESFVRTSDQSLIHFLENKNDSTAYEQLIELGFYLSLENDGKVLRIEW